MSRYICFDLIFSPPPFICMNKTAKTNSRCIYLHLLATKDSFCFQAEPSEGPVLLLVFHISWQMCLLSNLYDGWSAEEQK